ncbi:MAG: 5-formyltetrahydrofolate cyclo-ligase [Lentisphaeria bacterium]|nr:5-formyltetrahydrofolate cyclo-ligase [Lentisphaeria bacterium]
MSDLKAVKDALRKKFLALRAAMSPVEHLALNGAISARLLAMEEFAAADTVVGYATDGNEVDVRSVLENALIVGKKIALVRYDKTRKSYDPVEITSFQEDLEVAKFGLLEPKADLPKAVLSEKSLWLVPAVAFDRKGTRLGRGGGFYDRMLTEYPGRKVGVFYQNQYSEEALPCAEHDQKLDLAVTEDRVYKF